MTFHSYEQRYAELLSRLILNAEVVQICQKTATLELDIKKFNHEIALLTI